MIPPAIAHGAARALDNVAELVHEGTAPPDHLFPSAGLQLLVQRFDDRWAPCRAFSGGTGRMSVLTATVGNTTKRRAGR